VKVGKQYRYNEHNHDGVDWFEKGSIITITHISDNGVDVKAKGPAKYDGIAGYSIVKQGDIIDGWVRPDSIDELESAEAPVEPVAVHINLNGNSTTIVVQRNLTADEVAAVLKAINQ